MQYSPSWPFGLAVLTFTAKLFILRHTPETAPCHDGTSGEEISLDEYMSADIGPEAQQEPSHSLARIRDVYVNWSTGIYQTHFRKLEHLIILRDVRMVFACFAIKRVAFASLTFVFQFASEILRQDLSTTFLIRIYHQISVTILFIGLLPTLTRNLLSSVKDVWLIRVSLITLMIGFYIVWVSRHLSMFAFGRLQLDCGYHLLT